MSENNTVQIVARINGGDILFDVFGEGDEVRVKGNGHVQVEIMGRIYVLTERPRQISMGEREVRLDLLLENWLRFHMQGSLWWKSRGREWVLALGTVH
jgi:hypothetical protein